MNTKKFALVFSGGGARGAYEAGVFYYLRHHLAKEAQNRRFSVYTGTSVGAINACIAAAHADDHRRQAQELKRLWYDLKPGDVYARNARSLGKIMARRVRGIMANLFRGVGSSKTHFAGLLDTRPLYGRLCQDIDFSAIHRNIMNGALDACCVTATNIHSGRAELFIDKHPNVRYSGDYIHHNIHMQPIFPMASAAIPIVFPPQGMLGHYYVDGGLRLNTPLAPAIQLGANQILVISVQHISDNTAIRMNSGQVTLGEVLSRVFNGIFLDKVRSDVDQTQRINRIIQWAEAVYGEDFVQNINDYIKESGQIGDIANRGLQKLNVHRITPSIDLGQLFLEHYEGMNTRDFSMLEKTLTRVMDIDPSSCFDFLSYITFSQKYIQALFELGFEDCRAQESKLALYLA